VADLFTIAEILALAPDGASVKSAHELSEAKKWASFFAAGSALWGECQGSGSKPYQTVVDLTEPAFKCSCPSRKFPCKHGLGLLLFYAKGPDIFPTEPSPPEWASDWLSKRALKPQQQEAKRPAAVDVEPKIRDDRRAEQRLANVKSGLSDLQQWMFDLIRHGLADVPSRGFSFWDQMAARMVDAQAPGAARMLRAMGNISSSGDGWQLRLLNQLTLLHLLIEGFSRLDSLDEANVADIKSALGWSMSEEDLSEFPGIVDRWHVIGQRILEEDRLRARRTWLIGEKSKKNALLLHYAHGNSGFDAPLFTGMSVDGELVYYPSASPLRAIFKSYTVNAHRPECLMCSDSLAKGIKAYSASISAQPWLESYSLILRNVVPVRSSVGWSLNDSSGDSALLNPSFNRTWHILAISGGYPVDIVAEWDGEALWPIAIWSEMGLRSL
jgi:hypothetical protein